MKKNMQEKVTRWSIRRLSVGVASVVVASGFFIMSSPANSVLAKEETGTQVVQSTPDKPVKQEEKITVTPDTKAKTDVLKGEEKTNNKEKNNPENINKLIKNAAVDTALSNPKDSTTSPESTESSTNKPETEERAATPAETTPEQVKAAVQDNVKGSIDIPAAYLEKAEGKGPFTAGVNQVIPYEFFAGDGMLTRLLLKASDSAPWSDNGTAKNPALPPLEGLTKGKYFYEVDLNGNTVGKQGQDLIDQLKANGTQTYTATVKVYSDKDGKNLVATKSVDININGLVPKETVQKAVQDNVKENIDVPAAYLEKAEGVGPFTAGVNQMIPYEFFAGDGMLTRLLLKASDKAPWSDNGTAKNPALSPLGENMNTKGQYFYEVDLNGNTVGKQGQALIDQLRANGTQTYKATIKVYGNKDGKADLSNLVATREVRITLHKERMTSNNSSSTTNTTSVTKEEHARKDEMKPTTMEHSQQMNSQATKQEKAKKEELSTPMMKPQKEEAKEMKNNDSMKKESKATLPVTGETTTNTSALGAFSAGLAFVLGILGLKSKKERI